ncbi:thiolase domain-containing protein [Thermomicrobiaceae bacterium CFH 74404]|uniref:Thiolase domain-containing protein n=1 Tax=Thermalbibacter longus TaxID=2951981 RepID=A0AA41WDB5_9BACT|nr:thiolase domain-containing protein [Thermalbibacter longus]MCM8747973.1 thiolase domain-containing protein [Thermalbibacter longus]
MREVAIVGAAETRFGKSELSYRELAVEAARGALEDAGAEPGQVEALFLGSYSPGTFVHQEHVAPLIASELGLSHIPSTRVENACASGATAFVSGMMAIAAGLYDVVLVVGAEKMTSTPVAETTRILAEAADWENESKVGLTFPGAFALMAQAYLHKYGYGREILDAVAIKNHANALANPYAQFHKAITAEDIANSPMVADPLTLYDCSPISDGAAAILLVAGDAARNFAKPAVRVLGFGQASDSLALYRRPDLTTLPAARQAAQRAYRMAGVSPRDISLAEVHDCFTIAEIIATEDLGFFEPGEGGEAARAGATSRDGQIPVNPSGGLKAKGHPVGATGVGQLVEATFQLRGEAGGRQIDGVELALTHNVGGSGATCVVTILGRAA